MANDTCCRHGGRFATEHFSRQTFSAFPDRPHFPRPIFRPNLYLVSWSYLRDSEMKKKTGLINIGDEQG